MFVFDKIMVRYALTAMRLIFHALGLGADIEARIHLTTNMHLVVITAVLDRDVLMPSCVHHVVVRGR